MARSLLRGFFSRLHLGSWALFTVAFGFTRSNHNFTSFLFLCMINNKAVVGSAANKTCVCFCMSFEDIFPPHPCHYFHTATKAASTAFPAPVGCNEPSDACQTHVRIIFCVYMRTWNLVTNIYIYIYIHTHTHCHTLKTDFFYFECVSYMFPYTAKQYLEEQSCRMNT